MSERCYRRAAASLSASLPSQALRASSPKGRALGEEGKPHGISKASPFGRGVTEGDGEGKPVTKRLLTQRWASAFVKAIGSLCKSFRSGILALSGAPRQLSQRESLGRRGEDSRNIQSLSLWEQQRRPPPVAETGSRCWGRGQQDASESEADAGSRNPGSVTEGDGEGKPVTKRLLTQRWAGSLSERCYRNMAASLSASLPSQALRASSPKGRAFAEGKLHILLSPITISK